MTGKASSRARTRATRSGVSGGRLWVRMSSPRSAAAAGPTTTLATNGARQLLERDAFAGADLAPAQLRALIRTGDAVEQLDYVARVCVGLVDRRRQQRAGQRPLLQVRALGQALEALGALSVKREIQAMAFLGHYRRLHGTTRHARMKGVVQPPWARHRDR